MMKKLPTSAGLGDQFQSNVSSGDESAKGSSDFVETSEQRNVWNLHNDEGQIAPLCCQVFFSKISSAIQTKYGVG